MCSANRLRGGGGKLVVEIGFREDVEANAVRAQTIEALAEMTLIPDAADDDGGVFVVGREESPCGFQTGVTRLHHLLRVGQIAADEDVDGGPISYLVEPHDEPPSTDRPLTLRPAGFEPALLRF